MARTALPLTNLVANTGVATAAVAVDPTNGHVIDVGGRSGKLVLVINNTFAGTKVVTVRAGDTNPPAFRKDLGDITFTAAASAISYVGPFESARVIQKATDPGKVYVDLAAAITGTIEALFTPDTV